MKPIKVSITSRKTIKPSSPTPHHLNNFKLSLLDQLSPQFYGLIVFFYQPIPTQNGSTSSPQEIFSQRSLSLQNSLSKTLSLFYPMAGRLKDSSTIDCNDEGAYYVEAQADYDLSNFLTKPNIELVNHFLPVNDPELAELASTCIVLVQLTVFRCGGMALSVCLSHKVADVSSLMTFLQSWTCMARETDSTDPLHPSLVGSTVLPPNDLLPAMIPINLPSGKWVTQRLVFRGSDIQNLRDNIVNRDRQRLQLGYNHHYPSRIEVVLALILKCAISASSKSKTKPLTQAVLYQALDLRRRMLPPLPETSIGNLIWPVPMLLEGNDVVEMGSMVYKMRKTITEFCKEKVNRFKGEEAFVVIMESMKERREKMKDMESYRCTSWCRFPLYETDFGWGKPTWVSSASLGYKNTIVLLDTKEGDGIEAWVTLEEQEMNLFQLNEELLASCSFN